MAYQRTAETAMRLEASKKKANTSLFNVSVGSSDLTFFILVILLLAIGLVMLFSASYAFALDNRNDSFAFIKSQLIYAILGTFAMLLISTVQFKILEKFAWPIMSLTIGLLIIVLFFKDRNGAHRWIDLGFITFQPSEIAKFAVVILFSHLINVMGDRMKTFRYGIMPFVGVLVVIGGLMVLEPHLSGTILIFAIGAILMIVGGSSLKWFGMAALVAAAGVAFIILTGIINYASKRIEIWLDPFSDPRGGGFQTIQSLYAIGSGGLMGVGIGKSKQKHLFIPEPQNDFIFSVVCEELGFIGAVLIILLFALLVWRGFAIAMRCKDTFGSLVAIGLTAQVGLQAILNIMVVTNTIPNTGISLPFFSYGGTSLIMLLCQMGVVLSISRESALEKR